MQPRLRVLSREFLTWRGPDRREEERGLQGTTPGCVSRGFGRRRCHHVRTRAWHWPSGALGHQLLRLSWQPLPKLTTWPRLLSMAQGVCRRPGSGFSPWREQVSVARGDGRGRTARARSAPSARGKAEPGTAGHVTAAAGAVPVMGHL